MMYSVFWSPLAFQGIKALWQRQPAISCLSKMTVRDWIRAQEHVRLAKSVSQIELRLKHHGPHVGELRTNGVRVAIDGGLGIDFTVLEAEKVAYIYRVWHVMGTGHSVPKLAFAD
jgi:hypothetical protein